MVSDIDRKHTESSNWVGDDAMFTMLVSIAPRTLSRACTFNGVGAASTVDTVADIEGKAVPRDGVEAMTGGVTRATVLLEGLAVVMLELRAVLVPLPPPRSVVRTPGTLSWRTSLLTSSESMAAVYAVVTDSARTVAKLSFIMFVSSSMYRSQTEDVTGFTEARRYRHVYEGTPRSLIEMTSLCDMVVDAAHPRKDGRMPYQMWLLRPRPEHEIRRLDSLTKWNKTFVVSAKISIR